MGTWKSTMKSGHPTRSVAYPTSRRLTPSSGWLINTWTTASYAFDNLGSWTGSTTAGCASRSIAGSVPISRCRWSTTRLRKSGSATSATPWNRRWTRSKREISISSTCGRGIMLTTRPQRLLAIIRSRLIFHWRRSEKRRPWWNRAHSNSKEGPSNLL